MKPRTLLQMQNRPTCYEVGLYIDGKQTETIAFMARKTSQSLMKAASQNWEKLGEILTDEEMDGLYSNSVSKGFVFSGGRVAIKYTGKTERECATEALRLANAKP